jgi:hypothetical protein
MFVPFLALTWLSKTDVSVGYSFKNTDLEWMKWLLVNFCRAVTFNKLYQTRHLELELLGYVTKSYASH